MYWLPVILWMALIFSGSSDALSSQRTSRFIVPLLRWLYPGVSDDTIDVVQAVVRKTGHLTEYALLAVLFWHAWRQPVRNDRRPWCWREAAIAVGLAMLYAVTDEWHQSLVPSRDGRWQDVLIDSAGAVLGIVALWRCGRWRRWW
jgi:VanZ family protein